MIAPRDFEFGKYRMLSTYTKHGIFTTIGQEVGISGNFYVDKFGVLWIRRGTEENPHFEPHCVIPTVFDGIEDFETTMYTHRVDESRMLHVAEDGTLYEGRMPLGSSNYCTSRMNADLFHEAYAQLNGIEAARKGGGRNSDEQLRAPAASVFQ